MEHKINVVTVRYVPHKDEETDVVYQYFLVVELDGDMPRRDPAKPHLYVTLSSEVPEARLVSLFQGEGNSPFTGRYVRLRHDVSPHAGRLMPKSEANRILADEKLRLTRLGYAINGDASVWHCYIIDLDPPGTDPECHKKYVYVGMTSTTPENRLRQHKRELTSRDGKYIGMRKSLRPRIRGLNRELMESIKPAGPVYTKADALALEGAWARTLREQRYEVEAGPATPDRK